MAFDVDAFLDEKPEPKGTGTPPAPSMVREPRAKSDAELGIDTGPIKAEEPPRNVLEAMAPRERVAPPAKLETAKEANNPIAHDPLAGAIVASIPAAGAGALAGPLLEGAGAAPLVTRMGVGATEGATAAKLQGANPVTGAVIGAAIPAGAAAGGKAIDLAKAGAAKVIAGAPARAEARALTALTDDVRQTLKNRITEPRAQARIMKVLADKDVRRAADNPGKLLDISQSGLATNGEAAARGYELLDKAAAKGGRPGGMEVVQVTEPLLKLRQEMVNRSEHPTAIATVDRIIDQFRGGLGRDPSVPVPSADVRKFLTDQIQKPGFGVGDPLSDPPPARQALQEMAGKLKDALDAYARKHGGDTAADTMQSLNDKITAYSLMEKSAVERLAKSQQAPGAFDAIRRLAMGHKAEGIGATAGGFVAGPAGALLGAGAGHLASKAPAAIDEILASPAAQRFAAAGVPTRILSESQKAAIPVVSAINAKDPAAARRELAKLVVGQ